MPKISKRAVDALKNGPANLWDDDLKGFGVRATSSGLKTYVVAYRPHPGGRNAPKRWYTIGQHGSPWTPDSARIEAKRILGLVADKQDPARERKEERQKEGKTVKELVPSFLNAKKHLRSQSEIKRVLEREIVPILGKKCPVEVARHEIAAILDDVAERGPVMANRVRAYAHQFFRWCVERGHLETNPVATLAKIGKSTARDRVLTDEELAEIWKAAEVTGDPWTTLIKLLTLTAQRRNEVAGMKWSELDLDKSMWIIPAARAKNNQEHKVHLSPSALKAIKGIKRIAGCVYVLNTNGKTPISGFSKVKSRIDVSILAARKKVDKKAKPMPNWTFHDLRRTATTGMAALGISPHIADAVLNHKQGTIKGVAAVYNRHAYLEERKRALDSWEMKVIEITAGLQKTSNVIDMKR